MTSMKNLIKLPSFDSSPSRVVFCTTIQALDFAEGCYLRLSRQSNTRSSMFKKHTAKLLMAGSLLCIEELLHLH